MGTLAWSPYMALGIGSIDQAHQALLPALAQVACARDAQLSTALRFLVARLEDDFRAEESLMESIGFPELHPHREQHARLLGALHRTAAAAENGAVGEARSVTALLPHWFVFHLATMDQSLAVALQMAGASACGSAA